MDRRWQDTSSPRLVLLPLPTGTISTPSLMATLLVFLILLSIIPIPNLMEMEMEMEMDKSMVTLHLMEMAIISTPTRVST
mmetsp:Transcript_17674/g.29292  ORF Transcript_17674/g.29292 Transcript_17674/m.29292 type:complete len:80 (-) Transcript_17674:448-687(-)